MGVNATQDLTPSILAAIPMVRALARPYRHTRLGYDDAVGAGNLALVTSARHHDPSRGDFTSYAACRVTGAMKDALRAMRGNRTHPDCEVLVSDDELVEHGAVYDPEELDSDIYHAVRRLLPADRDVVLMRLAGYGTCEIAHMLGVSQGRISQRMKRVRRQLVEMRP